MNYRHLTAACTAALALAGCSTVADLPAERIGSATLLLANGQPAGTVQILRAGNVTTMAVAVTGVSPGVHGIHLHTTGACKAPDFTSAGGHLNPTGRTHGSLSAGGKHAGDLPNITVGAGGSGTLNADLTGSPEDVRGWLFDTDGTAVVLHADPDDYRTDPSGNSGARIACGVLRAS
ncbi:superoxide dismutase family protein [Altererythrobacter aerius]|uniref:Superoxide dismutase family protein n=1 Tax=Tsuneonella aeria TaxID=1837929 RepID=A0A6I4TG63_9SPHN|nr:superoxide dismutase family protein [Tsuneonella aeria]MXO75607.1 superoxide dismutase family protein [Tsuneonella aeria]